MSEERLEEARINIDWDKGKIPPDLLPHINYLFKQAERAEQNKNDWLNTMKRLENYEKVASLNNEEIQRLREQNKRYREAIEVAIHNMKDSDHLGVKFASGILEQALEESE